MRLPAEIAAAIQADSEIWTEFAAFCDLGGRVAGTESERQALALAKRLGAAATGTTPTIAETPYAGWICRSATLHLVEGGRRTPLACLPLLRSKAGAVEAEVVALGRGTPEEFAEAGDALAGRIALVRHEFMFAAGHIHRRRKLEAAVAAGAVGFLIEGPLPAAAVAGGGGPDVPALGVSPEAAARLAPPDGRAVAAIAVDAEAHDARTEAIFFDLPTASGADECVVLSAHLDGHAPAESALDNASGVAVALATARALAPHAATARRALRLAFFSAEEWALSGSRVWLERLDPGERARIKANVNLDSVAGARRLTALVSGSAPLGEWARAVSAANGLGLGVHLPLMTNSDHANFAYWGIPALRLVAGFDDPASNLRHVLTAADTRDKATATELKTATAAAAALAWAALTSTNLPPRT